MCTTWWQIYYTYLLHEFITLFQKCIVYLNFLHVTNFYQLTIIN